MSHRPADTNLILTGFMGSGKSAVGREVAARLVREFVDTDDLIERRTGCTIPAIFARDGEAAFRALEAEVCRELSARRDLVVATGGWTLGQSESRRALESSGTVVCLRADESALIERLGGTQGRPMLDEGTSPLRISRGEDTGLAPALPRGGTAGHGDWQWRLRSLLAKRLPTYLSFPLQVDTSRMTTHQAANCVVALWATFRGQSVPHALPVIVGDGSYGVLIGAGLLDLAGPLVAGLGRWTGAALVTDENVGPLYADRLIAALMAAAVPAMAHSTPCTIPAGEVHKTLDTMARLYAQLLSLGLDRGGLVLAMGGGVVGDVAGFSAATYMRGLSLIQLPTTLLAMVDSSVGGKTGVDLPQGKNLVGAFKQPELVIIDPTVLSTLPAAELRAGLAEVVKAGIIGSAGLFERLEHGKLDDLDWIVRQAIAVKIEVVAADPYERGRRAVLNLGHTFGHAFERLSDYHMRHGEAVAMGIVTAARLAVALGLCHTETARRIAATMEKQGLPTSPPDHAPETVWAAMRSDKKRQGDRLRFVLPVAIGEVDIFDDVPREAVLDVLRNPLAKTGDYRSPTDRPLAKTAVVPCLRKGGDYR